MPGYRKSAHDQSDHPALNSPFLSVNNTWNLQNNSAAARQEKESVYNTPSRFAAQTRQTSEPFGWGGAGQQRPAATPITPSYFRSPESENRMDIDTPEDFGIRVNYDDDDVPMDSPDGPATSFPVPRTPRAQYAQMRPQTTGGRRPFSMINLSPPKPKAARRSVSPRRNSTSDEPSKDRPDGAAKEKKDSWLSRKFGRGKGKERSKTPQRDRSWSPEAREKAWPVLASRPTPKPSSLRTRFDEEPEYESDGSGPLRKAGRKSQQQRLGPLKIEDERKEQKSFSVIASFFSFIDRHPNLPHILGWYIQLAFNCAVVGFFLYFLYSIWSSFIDDINKSSNEEVAEMLAEIAVCAKNYRDNLCDPATRVPAMETVCNSWNRCMSRNAQSVSRARVTARALAEIFNSFIEPISWKAFILIIVTFVTVAVGPSALLPKLFSRSPANPPPEPPQTPFHPSMVPPGTPHHFHYDALPSAGMYGPTPFSMYHAGGVAGKRAHTPLRPISLISDGEDESGEDAGRPVKTIEYGGSGSGPGPTRRLRHSSVEATVGRD